MMDLPPPYQVVAGAPRESLHLPIIPHAEHGSKESSPLLPRPSTPNFFDSTSATAKGHRELRSKIKDNLWQLAVEKLPEKERKALELPKNGVSTSSIVDEALAGVKSSEDKVNKNLIRVKTRRGEVPLRHYIDKLANVLNQFKEIGDNIVQYDPGHAALPWAGVRLLLMIAVNDSMTFQDMAEGIELVSGMITRYALIESLYLLEESKLKSQLVDGVIKLYAAILKYLGIAKNYYNKSTFRRGAESAIRSSRSLVEAPIADVRTCHVEVDEILKVIDAEKKKDSDRKLSNIQEGTDRNERLAWEMMRRLEPVEALAVDISDMRNEKLREEQQRKFQWLSTVPVQKHHAVAHEGLVSDTGLWLMERHHYIDWKQETKSCALLLHGTLGCGKTKLMSVIIQNLLNEKESNRGTPKVAFFYCNGSEQQRTKTQEILGAIARQLAWNGSDKPAETAFLNVYNTQKKKAEESNADQIDRLSIKELTELISKLVGEQTAVVLIDALDECAERLELLKSIRTIMNDANVKVMVSGRSEVCQDMPKEEFPVHVLIDNGANKDDIQKYAETEVDRAIADRRLLRGKVNDQLRNTIVKKLNDGAGGMFLWAKLKLQNLCDDGIKREKDVLMELDRYTPGISQLYETPFERIIRSGQSSRTVAESVFKWLLVSRRPLTIEAVIQAVSEPEEDDLDKDQVLDVCLDLVVADDETNTFRFAHLSVQEFLQKKEGFTLDELHHFAAKRCLEEFEISRQEIYNENGRPDPNSRANFYGYAVVNWVYHFGSIEKQQHDLVDNLESFLRDEEAFSIWNRDSLESVERREYWEASTKFESPSLNGQKATPTFIIAKFGLIDAFDDQKDILDWNYNNIRGQSPLHVAAFSGHLEIVERLIDELDVDLNQHGDVEYTALLAASHGGHRHVVENLLTREGIEINGRSNFGGTPLIAAARQSSADVCRLLIDGGAKINLQDRQGDTALLVAAEWGILPVVQLLLKAGADPNIAGREKYTALIRAVKHQENQYREVVKQLLRAGAGIDARSEDGETALHAASASRDLEMVRFLVAKKAAISVQDNEGKTALDYACAVNSSKIIEFLLRSGATCEPDITGRTELHEAVSGGCDTEIIKLLISKGVDINAKEETGRSTLNLAANQGNLGAFQVLLDAGAGVDAMSKSKFTLLHDAAIGGSAEIVRRVLSLHPAIDLKDENGMTPLAVACNRAQVSDEVIHLLLDAGADPTTTDNAGWTPLLEAANKQRNGVAMMLLNTGKVDATMLTESRYTALYLAASNGNYDLVRCFIERGASPKHEEQGSDSPLHAALRDEKGQKQYAIVEKLLEAGFDVNATNENGCTPLHSYLSYTEGKESIVRLLLSQGADINIRDNDGDTVLNCITGSTEVSEKILKLLMEHGAGLSIGNFTGVTPLHKFAGRGATSLVKILLEAGADPLVEDEHKRQPIQYAAKTNEATIRILLNSGAEVNVTASDWPSPIVYAALEANLQVLQLLLDNGAYANSDDPENKGWTALHAACKRETPDPAFAELLIAHGANVNAVSAISKTTPLHNAVASPSVVKLLLREGAVVDAKDSEGKTPLMCAFASTPNVQVIKYLLEAGADPLVKDSNTGNTPLHSSCISDEMLACVLASKKCTDLNVQDKFGWTPLSFTAYDGRNDVALRLLDSGRADVHVCDQNRMIPCMQAAKEGHVEMVRLLLEHDRAMILALDKYGNTALHHACQFGHLEVVKVLLEADPSNIMAQNCEGRTPFIEAASGHPKLVKMLLAREDVNPFHKADRDYTALIEAGYSGNSETVEILLALDGMDPRATTVGGVTIFIAAASQGLDSVCRRLIQEGVADCTSPTKNGDLTPLHYAISGNKVELIDMLLEQPGVELNARDGKGRTPLWRAVRREADHSIEALLAHGADTEIADKQGKSPLLVSVQDGNKSIVKMLLDAGAKISLDEALEVALARREEEIVQLLRDAGAIEHDDWLGIINMMGDDGLQSREDRVDGEQ